MQIDNYHQEERFEKEKLLKCWVCFGHISLFPHVYWLYVISILMDGRVYFCVFFLGCQVVSFICKWFSWNAKLCHSFRLFFLVVVHPDIIF